MIRYLSAARVVLVVMLGLATWLSLTPSPPEYIPPYDKPYHAAAYFALALAADFSFPPAGYLLPKGVPLFLYGLLMEILQRYVPGRSYEGLDLVANATGLLIYAIVSLSLKRLAFPPPVRERGQG